ncbi:MAG: 6-bladed beta-propeller [Vicinamibacterales bacterium]
MTALRVLLTIGLALLTAPLTSAQGVGPLVWPSLPERPRIRYLRTLTPQAIRRPPSAFSRFLRVVIGGSAEKSMTQPYGIAVGPDRRVYVADSVGGVIHVYNAERSDYSTIKVDAASLIGVAVVGTHIFVTDSVSGRVLCLDAKGRVEWSRGPRDGFVRPTGLAASADRLYVVDTAQSRVVVLGLNGAMFGTLGTRGSAPGQFNFPTNIVVAADGRLLVTDTLNFRVQVLSRDGKVVSTFGRLGDGPGDFDKPKGIAVDSGGHIYVVEGMNDVVQIFDPEGRLLLTFGGSGGGAGQLWLPSGIAIVNDVVYVADSANRRVQVFEYMKGAP